MKEIPINFIISSRLCSLEAKDIIKIVYLAGNKWNEKQVMNKMKIYPNTPIIGVGISNPQELNQVISRNIPIIHIENDCKALLAVEKRNSRNRKIFNRILMISSGYLWGIFGYKIFLNKLKRGEDNVNLLLFERGNLPIPNHIFISCITSITILLCLISSKLLNRIRNEYTYFQQEGQVLLIRNDVQYSKLNFFLGTVIPYCFIGFSVYRFRRLHLL